MKLKFILSIAFSAMVITFISCSKASVATSNNAADSTYFIAQDSSSQNGNNEQVRIFMYNSSNELIKVEYRSGGNPALYGFDTIYYANNYPSKLVTDSIGNSGAVRLDSSLYYYSQSGLLDSMREIASHGTAMDSRIFVYSGNNIDSMSSHFYYGSPSGNGGGPQSLSNILYTGNNVTSAVATIPNPPNAPNVAAITLTNDLTAPNPYYGLVFNGNVDNITGFFDHNNILKIYPTLAPTNVFGNSTYTYANGRVATIVDSTQTPIRVTTITYVKL